MVSVVIPTFNSERFLERCLRSVRGQTYPNVEVIVVDNYSRDKTREIAKKYADRVVLCRAGRSKAKNVGVNLAKGDYVLFIDSDMELSRRVIEECLEAVEKDERVGGVVIPERSVGDSFWVRVRDFERSFYAGTEVESARFFRKDLVLKVGGFDEDIVFFEESTLPQKIAALGFNVKVRIKAEILHHEGDFFIWKWLKKKLHYGRSAIDYKEKYGGYALKQLNAFHRLSIFLKNRKFFSKPLLMLGVIILKLLEFFSTGLGYLAGKMKNESSSN